MIKRPKPDPQSTLVITKLAGAQRQLDAAIRLFFSEEDDLAIHTLAAAAHRVLRDLDEKRAQKIIPDYALHYGMFEIARAFATGTEHQLPASLRAYGQADDNIAGLAQLIRNHVSTMGNVPEFEDFKVTVPKRAWGQLNRAANFLKHADRDFTDALNADEVDNLRLLGGGALTGGQGDQYNRH